MLQVLESVESVNPHFFRQLISLAESEEVKATEDVFSATGVKLIGKGARINESIYERIVAHKLKKPLETSITVGEPVTPQSLLITAETLLDSSPSLTKLLGAGGENVLGLLKRVRFGEQAGSLLKVHQSRIPSSLSHGMLVGLLGMGILKRMRPNDGAAMDALIVASIFHDIGELYIDPALYAERSQPLSAQEWRQMTAHPAIGHAVLKNMEGVAPVVADLVLEHHERMDGWGYPRGKLGDAIVLDGHVLAVAEALSQFIGRHEDPFSYAEIALKIIPGEFSTKIIDVVAHCREELHAAQLLQADIESMGTANDEAKLPTDFQPSMNDLFLKIGRVCEEVAAAEEKSNNFSVTGRKTLGDAKQRIERITRAISSSGLDIALDGMEYGEANAAELNQIRLEFEATMSEVRWRLNELSRHVTLQCANLAGPESEALMQLANALGTKG